MHEFPKYPAPNDEAMVALVARHPFALVVSAGDAANEPPIATHTPVILDPDAARPETLVGETLLGHMARVNEQWHSLDGARVLLVFSGPHDYVSPTSYGYDPAVPTWDYAAVHLTARVELVDDASGCMEIVTKTVTALEAVEPEQWNMTSSLGVFERIIRGVVGFRLHVETQKAVFKLSQDMPADVRGRVADASRGRGAPYGDVATLIEKYGPDDAGKEPMP